MDIRCGTDVTDVARFVRICESDNRALLERIFLPEELIDRRPAHLAGIFAAKEAVIKAYSLQKESWLDIRIGAHDGGKPYVQFAGPPPLEVVSDDVSIAHDGGIAIATYVAIVRSNDTPLHG